MTSIKISIFIFAGALLIYCAGLREAAFTSANIEAAEAVRAMVDNGESTSVPVFLMRCASSVGGINPLTVALPGAIVVALLLVSIFLIGAKMYSVRYGIAGALLAFSCYPLLLAVRTAAPTVYLPALLSCSVTIFLMLWRKPLTYAFKILLPLIWLLIALFLPCRLNIVAPLALIAAWFVNNPWHLRIVTRLRWWFFLLVKFVPAIALVILFVLHFSLLQDGVKLPLMVPGMVLGVFMLSTLNLKKGFKGHDRNLLLLAIFGLTIAIGQIMIIEPLEQHSTQHKKQMAHEKADD